MLRRTTALAVAVTAAFGASACGAEEERTSSVGGGTGNVAEEGPEPAESEALYVDLGGLKYQVQISRQLNPRDITDKGYFRGIAADESALEDGEVWFGVFLRVENESDDPIPAAAEFEVEDTRGTAFEPVESESVFAYEPASVPGKGYLPDPESLATGDTQGGLLLFKIPNESLDNRPLELLIKNPSDTRDARAIDLDV